MRTTRFDAAEYLASKEALVEYIAAAYATGDSEFIHDAHELVARARHKLHHREDIKQRKSARARR
jgi:DNA-binding phage protein